MCLTQTDALLSHTLDPTRTDRARLRGVRMDMGPSFPYTFQPIIPLSRLSLDLRTLLHLLARVLKLTLLFYRLDFLYLTNIPRIFRFLGYLLTAIM